MRSSTRPRGHRQTIVSLAKFGVTGGLGFTIDGAILTLLVSLTPLGPYLPRLVSFPVALCATWYLNRVWTFRRTDQRPLGQSMRYVAVQIGGAIINLVVYTAMIAFGSPIMAKFPIVALAIASIVAMAFSYLGSRHWAFAGKGRPVQKRA